MINTVLKTKNKYAKTVRNTESGEDERDSKDMISKAELFGTDAKGLYMLNTDSA